MFQSLLPVEGEKLFCAFNHLGFESFIIPAKYVCQNERELFPCLTRRQTEGENISAARPDGKGIHLLCKGEELAAVGVGEGFEDQFGSVVGTHGRDIACVGLEVGAGEKKSFFIFCGGGECQRLFSFFRHDIFAQGEISQKFQGGGDILGFQCDGGAILDQVGGDGFVTAVFVDGGLHGFSVGFDTGGGGEGRDDGFSESCHIGVLFDGGGVEVG